MCNVIGDLAFDRAMPSVRVAVLEGMCDLVDNVHAQPILKVLEQRMAKIVNRMYGENIYSNCHIVVAS